MRRRGFTLLEMMVVLMVVALAATIVVPRVAAVRGVLVDVEARKLADGIAFGRERAILSGTSMRVVIDAGSWQVGRPGREAGTLIASADDAPPLGRATRLAEGVRVHGLSVGGVPPGGGPRFSLDLRPDGDALAVRIALGDARGNAATVLVPPAGARPRVLAGARS